MTVCVGLAENLNILGFLISQQNKTVHKIGNQDIVFSCAFLRLYIYCINLWSLVLYLYFQVIFHCENKEVCAETKIFVIMCLSLEKTVYIGIFPTNRLKVVFTWICKSFLITCTYNTFCTVAHTGATFYLLWFSSCKLIYFSTAQLINQSTNQSDDLIFTFL